MLKFPLWNNCCCLLEEEEEEEKEKKKQNTCSRMGGEEDKLGPTLPERETLSRSLVCEARELIAIPGGQEGSTCGRD